MNKKIGSLAGLASKVLFAFLVCIFVASCAQKPNKKELERLENARLSAESAEAQLEKLKAERKALEEKLAEQKQLLEEKKTKVEKTKSSIPSE